MKLLMGGSVPVDTLCGSKMHRTGRYALRKRVTNTVRCRTSAESQGQAATPLPVAGTFSQLNGFAFTNQEVEDDWCEPAID